MRSINHIDLLRWKLITWRSFGDFVVVNGVQNENLRLAPKDDQKVAILGDSEGLILSVNGEARDRNFR